MPIVRRCPFGHHFVSVLPGAFDTFLGHLHPYLQGRCRPQSYLIPSMEMMASLNSFGLQLTDRLETGVEGEL